MTSMQMKSLIRNMAKEKNINAQILLRNYMLERLLERISKSRYKENFVLKGGMLVASMVGIDTRSTIDLDATLRNFPLTKEKIISEFDAVWVRVKPNGNFKDDDPEKAMNNNYFVYKVLDTGSHICVYFKNTIFQRVLAILVNWY